MDQAAPQAAEGGQRAELQALDALQFHWGDAYELGTDAERGWWAKRRDGLGGYLTADGPEGLYSEICEDYLLNPVPREFDPAGGGQDHGGAR